MLVFKPGFSMNKLLSSTSSELVLAEERNLGGIKNSRNFGVTVSEIHTYMNKTADFAPLISKHWTQIQQYLQLKWFTFMIST